LVLICGGERVEGEALVCGLLTGLKTGHYIIRTAKSEKRVPRLRLPEAGKLGMTMREKIVVYGWLAGRFEAQDALEAPAS
jgi:hypothetical protein